jgi:hypothetical protein
MTSAHSSVTVMNRASSATKYSPLPMPPSAAGTGAGASKVTR